jgi:hypothetical protein
MNYDTINFIEGEIEDMTTMRGENELKTFERYLTIANLYANLANEYNKNDGEIENVNKNINESREFLQKILDELQQVCKDKHKITCGAIFAIIELINDISILNENTDKLPLKYEQIINELGKIPELTQLKIYYENNLEDKVKNTLKDNPNFFIRGSFWGIIFSVGSFILN